MKVSCTFKYAFYLDFHCVKCELFNEKTLLAPCSQCSTKNDE